MKLTDRYCGGDDPFEGDRELVLRSIPADARILGARATVTPVQGSAAAPFVQAIAFEDGTGDWGTTKLTGAAGATRWVEVDFHARRTLGSVLGEATVAATLQVDVGGVLIGVANDGTFMAPGAVPFPVNLSSTQPAELPGLAVAKFRLTNMAGMVVDVREATVRSFPTNVSLRLGQLAPFWVRLGEITRAETSPDFATVLQAFLDQATVAHGYAIVPLTVHSDLIARLDIRLEIDYFHQMNALAARGLTEAVMSYDHGSLPRTQADVLRVRLPTGARVVPGETVVRVTGAFDPSRVIYGPVGAVTPVAMAPVTPAASLAQPFVPPANLAATGVDLLLAAVTRAATLSFNLLDDADGKPLDGPLLAQPVTIKLDREVNGAPTWISVPLPVEFQFAAKRRLWLVMQAVVGEAGWGAERAPAGARVDMQVTRDGGLSWRGVPVVGTNEPLAGLFRLRHTPAGFEIPIDLRVGEGEHARIVPLDRFNPLGRVDFALDFDEVADAFNEYLSSATPAACPLGEHLENGDFDHWWAVGNTIMPAREVQLGRTPGALVVGPDGRRAYVAGVYAGNSYLQVLDVACDTVDEEIELMTDIGEIVPTPNALAVHPHGTRAYVVTLEQVLQIVDTVTGRVLGAEINLRGGVRDLAVAPGGSHLYVTEYFEDAAGNRGAIRALDTALLEDVAWGTRPLADAVVNERSFDGDRVPVALAVGQAAGGSSTLYVAIIDLAVANAGELHTLDTTTLNAVGVPILIGTSPSDVEVIPDGHLVLVTFPGDNAVRVIDAASRSAEGGPIMVGNDPRRLAVAPDGARAFVVNAKDGTVSVVDLTSRSVVGAPIAVGPEPFDIAATLQGDRLYVANRVSTFMTSVPVGTQIPAEWTLTSGRVTPYCLPEPFHRVAVLGSFQQAATGTSGTSGASNLSQVFPVAGECEYEFRFWGVSRDPGAMAEIFWLGADCGLLWTDQIPIAIWQQQDEHEDEASLMVHGARLTAPPGGTQAELRFSVPRDGIAVIDRASLAAIGQAVANADLRQIEDGVPVGWTIEADGQSDAESSLSVSGETDEIHLTNSGAVPLVLTQKVGVSPGREFVVQVRGRPVGTPSEAVPSVVVSWFEQDGTSVGDPVILDVDHLTFEHHAREGVVPDGAVSASLVLVLPPWTTLAIQYVSLEFLNESMVPVSFVSEAPGELTVSDIRVTYDRVEVPPPHIEDGGLCRPTLPGQRPGTATHDYYYCPCCQSERAIADATPAVTPAGQPAMVARCEVCGADLLFPGGPLVTGRSYRKEVQGVRAPVFPVVRPPRATRAELSVVLGIRQAPYMDTSAINGIAAVRARRLAESGIDSVERLAAAAPADIVFILKGVSVNQATKFVEEAKHLLRASAGGQF